MKLTKASWMILAIGIFLIVLTGMGLTRSGQVKELARVNEELRVASTRLNNTQVTQSQNQINELQEQLSEAKTQTEEAKHRLEQTLVSVDVYEKFFKLLDYYGVVPASVTVSRITQQKYNSIECDVVSISAAVSGDSQKITDFIIGLNNNFTTGFIKSLQLTPDGESGQSSLGLQMTVYSRKSSS